MTNRRAWLLGGGIGLLVLLNLWNWWPRREQPIRTVSAPASGFQPADFRLKMDSSAEPGAAPGRDLFQPRRPPPLVSKVKAPPPPPPPKTPEQLAEEAARAELVQFRLLGIVIRAGRSQAYLMKGDQSYMVSAGDRAGDHFTVEAIGGDNVLLKDPRTGVSGQIPVSGK